MPSFNVQNAKALTISEGDVKTIHDSNDQLLWGAVGYSTKYDGDTYQYTTTGKNLWGGSTFSPEPAPSGATVSYLSDGSMTVTGTVSASIWSMSTAYAYANNRMIQLNAGTYTFYVDGGIYAQLIGVNTDGTGEAALKTISSGEGEETITLTGTKLVYPRARLDVGTSNVTVRFMIASGDGTIAYEPYTAGPSPNPDYPQSISVVTGTQTITLSDGTNTEDFTVSLGSEELCKIGDYQDYIYKTNGNWYKHAEVGKEVYDNASSFTLRNTSAAGTKTYAINTPFAYKISASATGFSNCFTFFGTITGVSVMYNASFYLDKLGFALYYNTTNPDALNVYFNTDKTTAEILAEQNIVFYYQLATPTDTQITDTTLIGQLDAIEEWLTRYGYTATVSGSLPLIINQTTLS